LSIAFTTAQRAIQRLEQKRVVRRTINARRNRVYCTQALLDILEEPAQLKPISSVQNNDWTRASVGPTDPTMPCAVDDLRRSMAMADVFILKRLSDSGFYPTMGAALKFGT
jgi:hypothetical protein